MVAYRAVGVPQSRIYIINPHSVVSSTTLKAHYSKSYVELSQLVHHMFPSLLDGRRSETEFNDVNYWRQPLPPLSDDERSEEEEDSSDDEAGWRVAVAGEAEKEAAGMPRIDKLGLSRADRKEAEQEEEEISKDQVLYKV